MKKIPKTTYEKGLIAEYIAGLYLWVKGYRLLKHRFKTPFGELDWVAQKGNNIIAVEVKFRPSIDDCMSSISKSSQGRILKTLSIFAANHPKAPPNYETLRADLIAIAPCKIIHIPNAWGE